MWHVQDKNVVEYVYMSVAALFNVNRDVSTTNVWMTIKSLNVMPKIMVELHYNKHQDDEDNVSTRVLVMRKRIQMFLLMISNVFYVVKVAIRNINAENM